MTTMSLEVDLDLCFSEALSVMELSHLCTAAVTAHQHITITTMMLV